MVIGLTGGLATGKSTVAKIFGRMGAKIIDADRISRDIISKGGVVYNEIVEVFGEEILGDDGSIDRARLADLIFKDKDLRERLNRIAHPRIRLEIERGIRQFQDLRSKIGNPKILIIDAPLLIEAGMQDLVEYLIVVSTSPEEQLKRVMERDNLSSDAAMERISCQLPMETKLELADYVIDNNGSFEETRYKVEKIWKELEQGV